MSRTQMLAPLVAVLLSACQQPLHVPSGAESSQSLPTGPACHTDFAVFLPAFLQAGPSQAALIDYPLIIQRLVDGDPEPVPQRQAVSRNQVKLPILPPRTDRQSRRLELRTERQDVRSASVVLEKPDTDYQVVYIFQKDKCWKLKEVQDWSL